MKYMPVLLVLTLLLALLLAVDWPPPWLTKEPPAVVPAGEPPTAPMLRIETGFHTAMIRRIAADAQGRWLATASEDKTLRLWELNKDIQDAEYPGLLRTFRLPSGAGNEGKLYAVAMDPALPYHR